MGGLVSLVMLFFALPLRADDWVESVSTPGIGRLETVTDYFIVSRGMNYDARIPKRIVSGTAIHISFSKEGVWVERDFAVAGISIKGDLCRLHSKLPSQYGSDSGDTIYVKPCLHR